MKVLAFEVAFLDRAKRAAGLPKQTQLTGLADEPPKILPGLGSCKSGSGHDNFLKGVRVSMTVLHSEVFAAHILRYSFLDVTSSQSKQHCLSDIQDLNVLERYDLDTPYYCIDGLCRAVDDYRAAKTHGVLVEHHRRRMIRSVPAGFRMLREYSTNYLQLKTVYHQRKNHKEGEWQEFCQWCLDTLPEFSFLIGVKA